MAFIRTTGTVHADIANWSSVFCIPCSSVLSIHVFPVTDPACFLDLYPASLLALTLACFHGLALTCPLCLTLTYSWLRSCSCSCLFTVTDLGFCSSLHLLSSLSGSACKSCVPPYPAVFQSGLSPEKHRITADLLGNRTVDNPCCSGLSISGVLCTQPYGKHPHHFGLRPGMWHPLVNCQTSLVTITSIWACWASHFKLWPLIWKGPLCS